MCILSMSRLREWIYATETVLMNLLRDLKAQNKAVFVVHHDLNTVEDYFDSVMMLNMRLIACRTHKRSL